MTDICLIYTTCPDENTAQVIAEILLSERLVACTNTFPVVSSSYWWQGRIESSKECVMILKTTTALKSQLETRFLELHPYEVPCFLELPVQSGSEGYLQWLKDSVR